MYCLALALLVSPIVGAAVWLGRSCCCQKKTRYDDNNIPPFNTTNFHPQPRGCLLQERFTLYPSAVPFYPPFNYESQQAPPLPILNPPDIITPPPTQRPNGVTPNLPTILSTLLPSHPVVAPHELGSDDSSDEILRSVARRRRPPRRRNRR